jgi:putative ABC transport system permease protein
MRDLRFAVRLLARAPGFAAISILTLALGLGANTAFFSILYGVVFAEPPYPDAARLVSLRHTRADVAIGDGRLSRAEVRDIRERARSFSGVAAAALGRATLTATGAGEGLAERVKVSDVTPNLFAILGINAIRGRVLLDSDIGGPPAVVISESLWQSHFGGAADVLSRTIRLNGNEYAIAGVMPASFAYPEPEMGAWMPLDLRPRAGDASDRTDRYLFTVARLAPSSSNSSNSSSPGTATAAADSAITVAAAARDLQRVAGDLRHDLPAIYTDAGWSLGLTSLRDSQFGHMRLSLGVLQGGAALVLLIACVNVSIMSLLRAVGRRRELAIRFALGAGRAHVVRQLLTEAMVLCVLGALGGLLIASVSIDAFKAFAPADIPRLNDITVNIPVAIFMTAVLAIVTLIVGLAPIAAATRFRGIDGGMPTNRTSDGRATTRMRDGLTIVEIALAAALVICAGLTLRSLHKLLSVDVGFETSHVVSFKTNLTQRAYPDAERVERFYDALTQRLAALPGARSIGGVSYLPLSGEATFIGAAPAATGSSDRDAAKLQIGWQIVRGRYFETMGIALLHGRLFEATDTANAAPVAIVDAPLARRWFGSEAAAVGQRAMIGDATRTIVGVVRAVSHTGPGKITLPTAYAPQTQVYQRGMYTVIRTTTPPESLLRAARAALASIDPTVPLYFAASVETRYDEAIALPRFTAGLVSAFSTLALLLAGVGIFGVTAYAVTQRTREFGIRVALGAQRTHIGGIVLRRVGMLAALGIGIGAWLGFGAGSLMSGLLFEVKPDDPATFWIALAAIGVTALAATVVPLSQAVRVSPAVILKTE